jgi:hypothetical protein
MAVSSLPYPRSPHLAPAQQKPPVKAPALFPPRLLHRQHTASINAMLDQQRIDYLVQVGEFLDELCLPCCSHESGKATNR